MTLFENIKEMKEKKPQKKKENFLKDLTDQQDIESVLKTISKLENFRQRESSISFGDGDDNYNLKTQLTYQRAVFEQNFI